MISDYTLWYTGTTYIIFLSEPLIVPCRLSEVSSQIEELEKVLEERARALDDSEARVAGLHLELEETKKKVELLSKSEEHECETLVDFAVS